MSRWCVCVCVCVRIHVKASVYVTDARHHYPLNTFGCASSRCSRIDCVRIGVGVGVCGGEGLRRPYRIDEMNFLFAQISVTVTVCIIVRVTLIDGQKHVEAFVTLICLIWWRWLQWLFQGEKYHHQVNYRERER